MLGAGEKEELWRERSFAQVLDDDLVTGRFDRVVLVRQGGEAVRARLMDFKTGSAAAQEPAIRNAEQLKFTAKSWPLCCLPLPQVTPVLLHRAWESFPARLALLYEHLLAAFLDHG